MALRSKWCIALAASLALAACGGAPKQQPTKPIARAEAARPTYSDVVVDPAMLKVATDPCAEQLQEMCGPLLEYYAVTHHLPATLKELGAFSSEPLNFVCPVSGEQYVYQPVPLTAQDRYLIMWDAKPVHSGMRWAILAGPVSGREAHMEVIPVTDALIKRYLPAGGTAIPATPAAPRATVQPVAPAATLPAATQPGVDAVQPAQ